jgi:hypothetical protein
MEHQAALLKFASTEFLFDMQILVTYDPNETSCQAARANYEDSLGV